MRNSRWLRFGLATVLLGCGASAAFLVACGDDDVTPTPGTDSGGGTDTGTSDSPTDSPTDTGVDSGPKPVNAKLVVVNAATDFGPSADVVGEGGPQAIRVCFALAADTTAVLTANASPLPPQPDSPNPTSGAPVGIYIGTGGIFKSFGLNLEPLAIRPIIMNAKSMKAKGITKPGPGLPGPTCDEILKAGASIDGSTFTENVDYWKLDPIAPNTLKAGKSYALVLTGCTDDSTVAATTPDKCGPGFTPAGGPGKGNLTARVFELARPTTVPATELAAQFAHVSSSAAFFANGNNPGLAIIPIIAGFSDTAGPPATNFKVVPGKKDGGETELHTITDPKNITGVDFTAHAFTANPLVLPGAPLPLVKAASYPSGVPDGGDYGNGKAMTFFAVGDPAAPADAGGQFNLRSFHFLAFPNDPPVENYVP